MENRYKRIENCIRDKVLDLQYSAWSLFQSKDIDISRLDPHKILCVELNHLGDMIAITPALRALKNKFPQSEITLWTLPGWRQDVLKGNTNLSKIISSPSDLADDYDILIVFYAGRIWETGKLYEHVRDIPLKVGVTNHGMLSSSFPYLSLKVKYLKVKHIVEENLDVVRLLGADTDDKSYELHDSDKDVLSVLKQKFNMNLERPMVLLHPGSNGIDKYKQRASHYWSSENWAKLADYFVEKGWNVGFTGITYEQFLIDEIMSLSTHKDQLLNLVDVFDLDMTFTLIRKSQLMISIDSGPVHVAAAYNTPVISLMGPQDPEIWKPWSKTGRYILHDEVCTKCKKLKCMYRSAECMQAITVDEVIRLAGEIVPNPI